jgi:hypothetical protein
VINETAERKTVSRAERTRCTNNLPNNLPTVLPVTELLPCAAAQPPNRTPDRRRRHSNSTRAQMLPLTPPKSITYGSHAHLPARWLLLGPSLPAGAPPVLPPRPRQMPWAWRPRPRPGPRRCEGTSRGEGACREGLLRQLRRPRGPPQGPGPRHSASGSGRVMSCHVMRLKWPLPVPERSGAWPD